MGSSRFGELGLIIANSHPTLGLEVAAQLGITPLEVESKQFPNGELDVKRISDVSGMDVCIFSSLHSRYDTIGELSRMVMTIRGSATRVWGVFPFVMTGKADHMKSYGEAVAYKDTALRISSTGLELIAIFDQHSSQHPYFYDTTGQLRKVHHLYLMRKLVEYVEQHNEMFDGVLALDDGSYKRNKKISLWPGLKLPVSFVIKERDPITRKVHIEESQIVGDVSGMRIAAFDDMLQQGGTLEAGAKIAKYNGAKAISFFVVHNDFSRETHKLINPLLEDGTIDKIYTVGTLPPIKGQKWHKNMVTISPADLIADVITCIHEERHMRRLFLDI